MGKTQFPLIKSEDGTYDGSGSAMTPIRCDSELNGRPTKLFMHVFGLQARTELALSGETEDSIIEHGEIKTFVASLFSSFDRVSGQPADMAPSFDYFFSVTATRELGASNHLIFAEPQHTMDCPNPDSENSESHTFTCVPRNLEFFQVIFEVDDKG
jgi:hypothetical protein